MMIHFIMCKAISLLLIFWNNSYSTGQHTTIVNLAGNCSNLNSLHQLQHCYCGNNHNSKQSNSNYSILGWIIWREFTKTDDDKDSVTVEQININTHVKELCSLYPFLHKVGGKNLLIISEDGFLPTLYSLHNSCFPNSVKNKIDGIEISGISSLDSFDSIQKQLIRIKLDSHRTFIVFGSLTLTTNLLSIATAIRMTSSLYTWVLFYSELLPREVLPQNVFVLERTLATIDDSTDSRNKMEILNMQRGSRNCGMNTTHHTNRDRSITMIPNKREIIALPYSVDVKIYHNEQWVYAGKILKNETVYFPNFPNLLASKFLRIVTIIDPPFTMIAENNGIFDPVARSCEIGKVCWKYEANVNRTKIRVPYCCIGFCMDLLTHLENELHFSSDIYIVEDSTYGATVNGTWVGMVGDLVNHKADMVVAALTISKKRSRVISFTDPYMVGGVAIATLLEKSTIPFFNTDVFSPISEALWVALLAVTIISSFLLVVTERLGTRLESAVERPYSVNQSLTYIAGLLLQRDLGGEPPLSLSSRILSILFAIVTLVVMATYTAVLTANKVTYTKSLPITGFKDKKITNPTPSFKYATIADSAFTDMFQSSTDPDWNRMAHFMRNYNFRDTRKAIEKLKNGELNAIIHDYPVLYHFISKENDCSIQFAGQSIKDAGYGLAVAKNNSIHRVLSQLIRSYQQNGLIHSLRGKWMSTKCSDLSTQQTQRWDRINDFGGLFVMMFCGCGISVLLLMLEIKHRRQPLEFIKTQQNKYINNVFVNKAFETSITPAPPDSISGYE